MNENELKKKLGVKIGQYRVKKGLTQEQLGGLIDRSQRQVSLIEIGTCFPSCVTILRLAEVFDCSVNDLFDFELIDDNRTFKEKLFALVQNLPEEKIKTLYMIGKHI